MLSEINHSKQPAQLKNAHSIVMNTQFRCLCMVATCYLLLLVANNSRTKNGQSCQKKQQKVSIGECIVIL